MQVPAVSSAVELIAEAFGTLPLVRDARAAKHIVNGAHPGGVIKNDNQRGQRHQIPQRQADSNAIDQRRPRSPNCYRKVLRLPATTIR